MLESSLILSGSSQERGDELLMGTPVRAALISERVVTQKPSLIEHLELYLGGNERVAPLKTLWLITRLRSWAN